MLASCSRLLIELSPDAPWRPGGPSRIGVGIKLRQKAVGIKLRQRAKGRMMVTPAIVAWQERCVINAGERCRMAKEYINHIIVKERAQGQ